MPDQPHDMGDEPAHRAYAGPGLHPPLPPPLSALLRRAVAEHVTTERRRRWYDPVLHVGVPGQGAWTHPGGLRTDGRADHTLRTDVTAALLARARVAAPRPLVWLTRPGPLHVQDVDAVWLAAAWAACAEAGVPLTMVVVNRQGWRDPRSGAGRVWSRVRPVPARGRG